MIGCKCECNLIEGLEVRVPPGELSLLARGALAEWRDGLGDTFTSRFEVLRETYTNVEVSRNGCVAVSS